MDDLGAPASYLTLGDGTAVHASGGEEVGKVAHVLADPDLDVFEGLVMRTGVLPGEHRFVDADQVAEIRERGVELTLSASEAQSLPQPSESPAALGVDADDVVRDELHDKLRRAWNLISGKG
jgi:uncharacterized protein YrrD